MRGNIINRVYYKREKESAKLRLCNGSWTILVDEVSEGVDTIIFYTEKFQYRINAVKAFSSGFTKVFDGENKLVVPIKFWDMEALPDNDQEAINQAYEL